MVNETVTEVATVAAGGGFNAGLDKALGIIIPLAVFGMFGFMIYRAFQEPLNNLFSWIGSKFKKDPVDEPHVTRFSGIQLDPNSRAEIYK